MSITLFLVLSAQTLNSNVQKILILKRPVVMVLGEPALSIEASAELNHRVSMKS